MKRSLALGLAGLLAISSCWSEPTIPSEERLAPFTRVAATERATDRYIVVLVDTVTDVAKSAHRLAALHGGTVGYVYDHVLHGFSVTLPAAAIRGLRANPAVRRVTQVEAAKFHLTDHTYQLNAPWNLDRVDQRTSTSSYYYYSETGSGVHAYIIDSGIHTAHTQFGGRATVGVDERPQDGQNGQDCLGHGTHVAGTLGGTTYGIAKSVSLVAVRVTVGCTTGVDPDALIAGVNWVAANQVAPAVANMSLSGPADADVDQAVNDAIASGVTIVVAAGNDHGQDACLNSPARVPAAITVAAIKQGDSRAEFSNVGSCVDIFAPGRDVLSAWYTSNTATHVDSGTSMATPHVTGAAARILQFRTTATPSEVASAILSRATQDVLTDIGTGSPNLLLYTRFVETSVSTPTITSCGTYTWTATGSGIGSSFTYGWERWVQTGFPPNGGFWGGTVPGQSYSADVCPGDNTFHLRASATNEFGMHGSFYINGT